MSNKTKWWVVSAAFMCMLCMATFGGSEVAEYFVLFFVWLSFAVSWVFLNDEIVAKVKGDGYPEVSEMAFNIKCWIVLLIMIWFGWMWTSIAYFVMFLLHSSIYRGNK